MPAMCIILFINIDNHIVHAILFVMNGNHGINCDISNDSILLCNDKLLKANHGSSTMLGLFSIGFLLVIIVWFNRWLQLMKYFGIDIYISIYMACLSVVVVIIHWKTSSIKLIANAFFPNWLTHWLRFCWFYFCEYWWSNVGNLTT